MHDNVNNPSHYTAGKVECIDAMEAAVTGLEGMEAVLTAQVLKYIWRWKKKNGLEDLRKAEWYLTRLIRQQQECRDTELEKDATTGFRWEDVAGTSAQGGSI